jgi:hypothetical protein
MQALATNAFLFVDWVRRISSSLTSARKPDQIEGFLFRPHKRGTQEAKEHHAMDNFIWHLSGNNLENEFSCILDAVFFGEMAREMYVSTTLNYKH